MVTHEFTVFPSGRVDGCLSVREGDRSSHKLRFVLMEGLQCERARLMLWPTGEDSPTVYDTAQSQGTWSASEVSFTPTEWGQSGNAVLQLELRDAQDTVVWQSRRFWAAVGDGLEDEGLPPLIDTSEATATPADVAAGKTFGAGGAMLAGTSTAVETGDADAVPGDVLLGKTFYAGGEKQTGTLDLSDATAGEADIRWGEAAYTAAGKVSGKMMVPGVPVVSATFTLSGTEIRAMPIARSGDEGVLLEYSAMVPASLAGTETLSIALFVPRAIGTSESPTLHDTEGTSYTAVKTGAGVYFHFTFTDIPVQHISVCEAASAAVSKIQFSTIGQECPVSLIQLGQ